MQEIPPMGAHILHDQQTFLNQEIQEILKTGAIKKVTHIQREFLNNIFIVRKNIGGTG